ncbi:MAG: serine hydrolase domain-containing protein [Hyphomicrobiaceae bacterium]|nr:serine hydrolase domain-containing protein [Hyphomicrobiaceae bacterium]
MTRSFVLMAVVVAGLMAVPAQTRAGAWTPEKTERVDRLVDLYLRPGADGVARSVPSVAIAIGGADGLLLSKGYGVARPGRSASGRTVYRIGSLAKAFTAAAVLSLVARPEAAAQLPAPATVHLDTPVAGLLDGVGHWRIREHGPVTLRDLLTMRSNLPNFTQTPPRDVDPWGSIAAPQLLGAVRTLSTSPTGFGFEYSNTNYFLLSEIVERLTGRTFREEVRARVLAPAGLTRTFLGGEPIADTDVAVPGYGRRPAFALGEWLKGSADAASSAEDLFAWNHALMETEAIPVPVRTAMWTPAARIGPSLWYGMGWFIEIDEQRGTEEYFHSGTVPGYTAFNLISRRVDDAGWVSVSILTNRDEVDGLENLASEIVAIIRE